MLDELLVRAQQAIESALAAGADEAFAGASRKRTVETSVRDGELERVQENTSRKLGLQVYAEGRYSTHSTTDLRPAQLQAFVEDAVALTRALEPDPHRSLPEPVLYEGRAEVDLELVDPELSGFDQERRTSWTVEMNEAVASQDEVISATSGVYDDHVYRAAASSNGFAGTREATSIWTGTEVTLQGEGERRPEDWMWVGGRHAGGLPSAVDVSIEALARARARLGSTKGPTRKATMIVEPRAAGRLVRSLLGPATARGIQQKRSFWTDRIGQSIASDKLTVVDDPLVPRGLASRTWDGEGHATRRRTLIEAGVARELYVDTYYGRKAELAPTSGTRTNRLVLPGDKDLAGWLAEAGVAVLVTSWLGGNSDRSTGDFSFGMRGHLVSGGEVGAPVGEMNVTGNLVDLFAALVGVGSDPWRYRAVQVPTLVFEGVQFSGA